MATCSICGAHDAPGHPGIVHFPDCPLHHANMPGYWQNETSGILRPVIEAWLRGRVLSPRQVATMRAYLRQWIMAPGFIGPGVEQLREAIDGLTTDAAIQAWLDDALEEGIDPL